MTVNYDDLAKTMLLQWQNMWQAPPASAAPAAPPAEEWQKTMLQLSATGLQFWQQMAQNMTHATAAHQPAADAPPYAGSTASGASAAATASAAPTSAPTAAAAGVAPDERAYVIAELARRVEHVHERLVRCEAELASLKQQR